MNRSASVAVAALGCLSLTLGGCLVASSRSTYEVGRPVSSNTLSHVETGTTTREWLIATLGEPTHRTIVDGESNVEILRYDYQRREESGGSVFLLFAGSSSKSTSSTAYFELTDGVVTRYWTE